MPRAVDRIVYGTDTVIDRQAHAHLRHGGPFETCVRCHGQGGWEPGRDFGIVIMDGPRLMEEESEAVRRLLVP